MPDRTIVMNVSLCLPEGIHDSGALVLSGQKIEDVLLQLGDTAGFEGRTVDGQGFLCAPSYIDSHCHGGNGFDCNDGTEEAVIEMSRFYAAHGIAAYFPSTSSDPLSVIEKGFDCIRRVRDADAAAGVEILGTHMEGPFINPVYRGCQGPEHILEMTDEPFEVVKRNADLIGRITIAPEIPANGARIEELVELGIVVAIGHSAATYAQVQDAVNRGASMVTHLYNAMSSTKKEGPFRVCGVLEAGLDLDGLFTEIIADRKHLPDELMRIAYRCKGADRLMVCSDANRGAGVAEGGTLYTCGQEAVIHDGVAMLPDRSSLASSTTPIDAMVRNLVNHVGIPLHDALRMGSATPAAMLHVDDRKGALAKGMDADFILLDEELTVRETWGRGRRIYAL
ncbi:MAG: N-acetylglucosamine-6-phosphate deacetylase [Planctomycetota bacterium]|jgi:N-acetylglucosamine-6-phosphate deacetylase